MQPFDFPIHPDPPRPLPIESKWYHDVVWSTWHLKIPIIGDTVGLLLDRLTLIVDCGICETDGVMCHHNYGIQLIDCTHLLLISFLPPILNPMQEVESFICETWQVQGLLNLVYCSWAIKPRPLHLDCLQNNCLSCCLFPSIPNLQPFNLTSCLPFSLSDNSFTHIAHAKSQSISQRICSVAWGPQLLLLYTFFIGLCHTSVRSVL